METQKMTSAKHRAILNEEMDLLKEYRDGEDKNLPLFKVINVINFGEFYLNESLSERRINNDKEFLRITLLKFIKRENPEMDSEIIRKYLGIPSWVEVE